MTAIEVVIRFVIVAGLGSYLYVKHRQRLRSEPPRYDEADWTGRAIDTVALKPTVERVRRDYLASRLPACALGFRGTLIKLAKRALSRLAYFQDRELERHGQSHPR